MHKLRELWERVVSVAGELVKRYGGSMGYTGAERGVRIGRDK